MAAAGAAGRFPRLILFFTVFLDVAGFGMILPLLPFYAQRYGAGPFEVGLLFSCYSLALAVTAPGLGRLSDRLGRRPVLLVALLVNAAALVLFAVGQTLTVLVVARTISGMAAANIGIAQAYVADVTRPEERARGLGLIGAALGLGFVLGPGLGGLLSLAGQVAVPLGAAVLTLADFVLVATKLPESLPPAERRSAPPRTWLPLAGFRRVDLRVRGLLGLFFVILVAFSSMEATLALYCEAAFGFGVFETSALMVMIGLVLAGVQGGMVGRLAARFGERRLVLAGIGAMAAGLVVLPSAQLLVVLGLASVLLAAGAGLNQPSLLSLVSRGVEADIQGSTLGLSRSLQALARTAGPLWGGWAFANLGIGWPFWSAGGIMLVALAGAFVLLRPAPAVVP